MIYYDDNDRITEDDLYKHDWVKGESLIYQLIPYGKPLKEALKLPNAKYVVNKKTWFWPNDTPLHKAARKGVPWIVRALLVAGAEMNMRNGLGETPLMAALKDSKLREDRKSHREMIEFFAKYHETDLDAADNSGWTPVMVAHHLGMMDIVEVILHGKIVQHENLKLFSCNSAECYR